MPRTKISEYSATAADNTDIDGINLGEGMFPSDVNNAIRELMSQIKDLQAGTSGDTIPVTAGGTGATTASAARLSLGATTTGSSLFTAVDASAARTAISAASSGANSNITSLTGLTTALSTSQGGTGRTTLTANNVLLGNGTSEVNFVAPGASGNVLTSNGTTWVSSAGGGSSLSGTTNSATPFSTFLGHQAGNANTGTYNTFIGYQTGLLNTSGGSNVAIGQGAMPSNTTSSNNVAVGNSSMQSSTSANNVSVGTATLLNLSTGASNTALGYVAGSGLTTGANNTVIGNGAQASSSSVSNTVTLGNSSIATLRCQVTTITSLSDARDKTNVKDIGAGLDFVNSLKPVFFTWNMRDGGKVDVLDTGFIAQQLQETQAKTGITIPGLVDADNPDKLEAGYGKLLPVLVKAIQELSAKVDAQAAEISALKAQQ